MLFVNISAAPLISTVCITMIGLVIFSLIRQRYITHNFFSKKQQQLLFQYNIKYSKPIKYIFLVLTVLMLGLSLLDPRASSLTSDVTLEGMDIILTFDISRSMDAQDVAPSRLGLAKNLCAQLLNSLTGNRVGLVAFAAHPLRMLPLTTDISTVNLFMQDLSTDMISSQSTDIGKALDESIKGFTEDTLTHKAIILFTDGENLDGNVDNALSQIKQQGISLLIVGLGTSDGGPIPVKNSTNANIFYLKNMMNTKIITKLDEESLKKLAQKSNGEYIIGSSASIEKFYNIIENIEKSPLGNNTQSFLEPKFRAFILAALIFLLCLLFIPEKKIRPLIVLILCLCSSKTAIYGITADRTAYEAFKHGEYSKALRYYQRSLVKNPKNLKAKFGEDVTLYKLERYDRSEKSFLSLADDASTSTSLHYKALFNAANTRVQTKNYEGAIDLYKKILRELPNNSKLFKKALNNLLVAQTNQHKNKEEQQDSQNNNSNKDPQSSSENTKNNEKKTEKKHNDANKTDNTTSQPNQEQKQLATTSPNDTDNLLSMAQDSEKENFNRQHKKEQGSILKQNKW